MTLWRCYYYTFVADKRLNHGKKKKMSVICLVSTWKPLVLKDPALHAA